MDGTTSVWRLLPYDLGSSARHFALSDALARHSPEPSVWWHSTDIPTLILGAGQAPSSIDLDRLQGQGVNLVQRQAGGTAVFAQSGVLGLDVVLPASHPLVAGDVVEAYRWLGEVWVDACRRIGVDAQLVGIEEARRAARQELPAPSLQLACFGTLSPYEVTVHGRKLVGLAQVRRRGRVLLQSGIHFHFDSQALARILAPHDAAALASALRRTALGLSDLLEPLPEPAALWETFHEALAEHLDVHLRDGDWSSEELLHASTVDTGLTPMPSAS